MKPGIIISLLAIIIIGCQVSPQQSDFNFENVFFDLADYFESEIEKNQNEIKSVNKTTKINADSSVIQLNDVDFAKELKLFIESDINKISWADRYKVDTIRQSAVDYKVNYTALSDKLQTRSINIHFLNSQPQKINIHNQLKSMIMDTDQFLIYQPGVGYSIDIKQHGKLQQGDDYYTAVRFD